MPSATLTFPAELRAVAEARRFVLATLADWGEAHYDFAAPLVVTELATNAALHARTPFEVRLTLDPGHLTVHVRDGSPRRPHSPGYGLDATTGRGINLVESVCLRWGVSPAATGKVVWAEVSPDETLSFPVDLDDVEVPDVPPSSTTVLPEQHSATGRSRDAGVEREQSAPSGRSALVAA